MVLEIPALPNFTPTSLEFESIPAFKYDKSLEQEIKEGTLTKKDAIRLYEQMLCIRIFEEMILTVRMNAYEPIKGFEYRGPTHLSIGQEATAAGSCSAINLTDYITSTHRGHGESIAKGCMAICQRSDDQLRAVLGDDAAKANSREELEELALEQHLFRTIAELFGKDAGYCRGRGGGMHIADFSVGHLGANAIVGGSLGIAVGAGLSARYRGTDQVVLCFAGDGAYANGVCLEAMNLASMDQFSNELAKRPFGIPTIFLIVNNMYGMTGQQRGETSSIDYLARRAAGFCQHSMHAEVINGMDPLAVRDAILRAAQVAREGHGPVLREMITYRFQGHSLSDPRNEYRTREEEKAWRAIDPLVTFPQALVEAGVCTEEDLEKMKQKAEERHARAAVRAAESPEPHPDDVAKFLFSNRFDNEVPEENTKVELLSDEPVVKRDAKGRITFKEAIKEALYEEMKRDNRVVIYGEDVADYGGAFKVTKGLLELFGRDRIFNTSISEAGFVGMGVGAAMTNLRPVVELMYSDFEFQAGDQICNQAAKWCYMSGGQTSVPMVIRTSTGAGKGYGGQHSQSVESHSTHTPGLKVAVPSTPYDAKGMLKTAIRDGDPVMFVESQALYNDKAVVPEEEYLVPFGVADIRREGKDITIVAWGFMVKQALSAAEQLKELHGLETEVIDPRTLIPLDIETILRSVKKTGRLIVTSQSCTTGSYTGEVCSQVQRRAFDYLDAPIVRVGAVDAVSPQSYVLETAYLPNAEKVLEAAEKLCNVKK